MNTIGAGFLDVPDTTVEVQGLYDESIAQQGFLMNATRLWAQQPALHSGLFDLVGMAVRAAGLTIRQRGILIVCCASAYGDSYCSLAWGKRLAAEVGAELASAVLRGDDSDLDKAERALAQWARTMTRRPNSTDAQDVQPLRNAGYDDAQIFAITAFVAFRLAFAIVNDALGARPDAELYALTPVPVRDAVTFGRPAC